MVVIFCDNPNCNGNVMELVGEDSRQEWYEAIYECPLCNRLKAHKREYDQNGLILVDKVEND